MTTTTYDPNTTWNKLIEQPMLASVTWSYPIHDLQDMEAWCDTASHASLLHMFLHHFLNGVVPPAPLLRKEYFIYISRELVPLYYFPFSSTVEVAGVQTKISLTFQQFKLLHTLYKTRPLQIKMPLIECPPEYWYFNRMLREKVPLYPQNLQDVKLIDITRLTPIKVLPQRADEEPLLYTTGSVSADQLNKTNPIVMGLKDVPPFPLRFTDFYVSREIYSAYPEYWDALAKNYYQTPLGALLSQTVLFCSANIMEEANAESEALYAYTTTKYDMVDQLDGTRKVQKVPVTVPIAASTVPFIQSRDKYFSALTTCPNSNCCQNDGREMYAEDVGRNNWSSIFYDHEVYEPDPGYLDEDELFSDDEFDLQLVMPDDCPSQDYIDFNDAVPYTEDEESILVQHEVAQGYFEVDSVVAKHASKQMFDQEIDRPAKHNFDVTETHWRDITDERFPIRTFDKFLWLYEEVGLIKSPESRPYPVGKPPDENGRDFLEISGAPWGAAAAAIESGIAKNYTASRFTGERGIGCPYEAMKNTVFHDFLEDNRCYSDIKSITRFYETTYYQLKEKPHLHSTIPELFDVLILDLPLHRNSYAAEVGISVGPDKKTKVLAEFCDAIPLGRAEAMEKRLEQYEKFVPCVLRKTGMLIVKLFEVLTIKTADHLLLLLSSFDRISFVRNPYSRPLSKEFYCVAYGYDPFKQRENFDYVRKVFFSSLAKFNTYLYARLTRKLIKYALREHDRLGVIRTINCRRKLRQMRGYPAKVKKKKYISWSGAPRPKPVVRIGHAPEKDVHPTPQQIATLFPKMKKLSRDKNIPYSDVSQMLFVVGKENDVSEILQDRYLHKTPAYRYTADDIDLVSQQAGVSRSAAVDLLEASKGDIVDAIISAM